MAVTLVTGPVRSGKSRFVIDVARSCERRVLFVATALRDVSDAEWQTRIERHRGDRPAGWTTFESAEVDHEALLRVFLQARSAECIVVDALGTWLGARLARDVDAFERDYERTTSAIEREAEELADAMLDSAARVIVVAEEVGWDVVPETRSARMFRDVLGRMKQRIAARAEHVFLVVCGYALDVRTIGVRIS